MTPLHVSSGRPRKIQDSERGRVFPPHVLRWQCPGQVGPLASLGSRMVSRTAVDRGSNFSSTFRHAPSPPQLSSTPHHLLNFLSRPNFSSTFCHAPTSPPPNLPRPNFTTAFSHASKFRLDCLSRPNFASTRFPTPELPLNLFPFLNFPTRLFHAPPLPDVLPKQLRCTAKQVPVACILCRSRSCVGGLFHCKASQKHCKPGYPRQRESTSEAGKLLTHWMNGLAGPSPPW